jgi:phosphate:Na+ symporter
MEKLLDYAATAQNDLKINKKQNNIITEIKIAHRKMEEIIKNVKDLNKIINLLIN